MKKLLQNLDRESWIGKHCETTAIKRVLDYYGFSFSEEFLFGLSGGIGFIYWYTKQMNSPFIGTKNKTKKGTIKEVCEKLNLEVWVKETQSTKRARQWMKDSIKLNIPVIVNVDLAMLHYTGVPPKAHFGGHAVAVMGYDEEKNRVYIFDRGKKMVSEDEEDFEKARNSTFQPFPPKNRIYMIQPPVGKVHSYERYVGEDIIYSSIKESLVEMRYPEIKNKGLSGFDVWSSRMKKWSDIFEGKDFLGCLMSLYTNIIIGGTGGDAFRSMYAQFLYEAAELTAKDRLRDAAAIYKISGNKWREIADLALSDEYLHLKQLKDIMVMKNKIFEDASLGAVKKMQDLQKQEESIIEMAAKEAVQNKKQIIYSLCQQVKILKMIEQEALARLEDYLDT